MQPTNRPDYYRSLNDKESVGNNIVYKRSYGKASIHELQTLYSRSVSAFKTKSGAVFETKHEYFGPNNKGR